MLKRLLTIVFLSLASCMQGCGSSHVEKPIIEYSDQTVELVLDFWENGLSWTGTCDDGVTSCRNYHYSSMDNDGVILQRYGCRPTTGVRGPSEDLFCHIFSDKSTQLSQAELDNVKRTIVMAGPEHLSHYYECFRNDSCTSDPESLSLHITVDGSLKTISYSDGGPAVSKEFLSILDAVKRIGI